MTLNERIDRGPDRRKDEVTAPTERRVAERRTPRWMEWTREHQNGKELAA